MNDGIHGTYTQDQLGRIMTACQKSYGIVVADIDSINIESDTVAVLNVWHGGHIPIEMRISY